MTSTADLFAYWSADPDSVAGVAALIRASDRFDAVWSPAEGWIAGLRSVPRVRTPVLGQPGDVVVVQQAAGTSDALARKLLRGGSPPAGDTGALLFAAGGAVVGARSCSGIVPLYLWSSAGDRAMSTTLGDLVRFLPVELHPDRFVWALWASAMGAFPDGRTLFADVVQVEAGSLVDWPRDGAPVHRRYWDPVPERVRLPRRSEEEGRARRYRELLIDAVEADVPDVGALLTVSGGVDSAVLAAIAGPMLGRQVASLSLLPEEGSASYERERSFVDAAVRECGLSPAVRESLSSTVRLRLIEEAPPVAVPVLHPALGRLAGLAATQEISVLIGGEFADETGSGKFVRPDWLRGTTPSELLRQLRRLPNGLSDARVWLGWHRRGMRLGDGVYPEEPASFVEPALREEYDQWRRERIAALAADERPFATVRALHRFQSGAINMNWEVCSELGIRRSMPFLDRDLLAFTWSSHPAEHYGPGGKAMERRAFRGLAPAGNLERLDKGVWRDQPGDSLRFPRPAGAEQLLGGVLSPRWAAEATDLSSIEAAGLAGLVRFAGNLAGLRADATTRR